MSDEPSNPGELPETEAEKKIREESDSNRKWIEEMKKKNAHDAASERTPLNKDNIGRIFANKPKITNPPENQE